MNVLLTMVLARRCNLVSTVSVTSLVVIALVVTPPTHVHAQTSMNAITTTVVVMC